MDFSLGNCVTELEHLCKAWSTINLSSGTLAPVADVAELSKKPGSTVSHSFESYMAVAPALENDARLHLSLLPQPYIGDLNGARVFILMLNPGVGPMDYYAELSTARDHRFVEAVQRNLRQDANREYPFFFLDPAFLWHPGATYWRKRLNWIVRKLMEVCVRPYEHCLRHVAQTVCCLQLVPYHSSTFGMSAGSVKKLESTKLVIAAANEIASSGNRFLAVMRQHNAWKLPKSSSIMYSAPAHRRGAAMTPGSELGDAIVGVLAESLK